MKHVRLTPSSDGIEIRIQHVIRRERQMTTVE